MTLVVGVAARVKAVDPAVEMAPVVVVVVVVGVVAAAAAVAAAVGGQLASCVVSSYSSTQWHLIQRRPCHSVQ